MLGRHKVRISLNTPADDSFTKVAADILCSRGVENWCGESSTARNGRAVANHRRSSEGRIYDPWHQLQVSTLRIMYL